MRHSRLYVPINLKSQRQFTLPDNTTRYVSQVLRLKPGATLTLFDGNGGEYFATLTAITRHKAIIETGDFTAHECESPFKITLAQGISRGERMDLTLQKSTELGVHRIVPLTTERCGVRLNEERRDKRQRHWQGVVASACEQSGRNQLPILDPVTRLSDWLTSNPAKATHAMVLDPLAKNGLPQAKPTEQSVTILIGPEGGLSDEEINLAANKGFMRTRLGPRVLRTETAGIAALAAIQTLWGDLA